MQGHCITLYIHTQQKAKCNGGSFFEKKKKKKTLLYTGPDMQINLLVRYKVHPSCKIKLISCNISDPLKVPRGES